MKKTCLSIFLLSLTSCAHHLSESECRNINWHDRGYQDSSHGLGQNNLLKEQKDCEKFNIKINNKAYNNGWQQGMKQYCTDKNGYDLGVQGLDYSPICQGAYSLLIDKGYQRGVRQYCKNPDNAYNLGRSGSPYPNFCPADLQARFRNAYNDGRHIFTAVSGLQNEIKGIDANIRAKQDRLEEIDRELRDRTISDGQYRRLKMERRDLVRDIEELRFNRSRLVSQKSEIETR